MARIQPSFLHFYLFRTQQHNTCFLLNSCLRWVKISEVGASFLNNPNFYPFGQQYFPLKNNSKPSPQIVKILHIDLICNPMFQISNPIPGGPSQLSLDTNQYLKFSQPPPLGWGDLHKTWYGFYQYPKYRSHSRETSQNTSNFHNFSKHRTRPTALTMDPKVYEHSPDNIIDAWNPPRSRIKILISNYHAPGQHSQVTTKFNS